ncbi:hypothetical protein VZT92_019610 [Zoarces viviparus]|uniref:Uncharacterized protein n=1 Tax=Zoarces viviparus TaxID=48416 RepID=A0AAW1ELG2_ZOAVI
MSADEAAGPAAHGARAPAALRVQVRSRVAVRLGAVRRGGSERRLQNARAADRADQKQCSHAALCGGVLQSRPAAACYMGMCVWTCTIMLRVAFAYR